jgi:hypothetical protein
MKNAEAQKIEVNIFADSSIEPTRGLTPSSGFKGLASQINNSTISNSQVSNLQAPAQGTPLPSATHNHQLTTKEPNGKFIYYAEPSKLKTSTQRLHEQSTLKNTHSQLIKKPVLSPTNQSLQNKPLNKNIHKLPEASPSKTTNSTYHTKSSISPFHKTNPSSSQNTKINQQHQTHSPTQPQTNLKTVDSALLEDFQNELSGAKSFIEGQQLANKIANDSIEAAGQDLKDYLDTFIKHHWAAKNKKPIQNKTTKPWKLPKFKFSFLNAFLLLVLVFNFYIIFQSHFHLKQLNLLEIH